MENSLTWLLIADASKARLYAIHKAKIFQTPNDAKNLNLVGEYGHAASRKKDSELAEFGTGTLAIETTSPKIHEAEQFAQELLAHLEAGRKEKTFRDLIIVAPPTFMGLLNKYMSHEIQKLITQKIEKDYTQYTPPELLTNLLAHF